MNKPVDLTSGHLFARNTILNLAGEVVPFLTALVAIPILLRSIGADAYGILSLSAMVVGYFGLFDFGLGAAGTKLKRKPPEAGSMIESWTPSGPHLFSRWPLLARWSDKIESYFRHEDFRCVGQSMLSCRKISNWQKVDHK